MAEKDLWTAPSYFNITLCGLGDDFGARPNFVNRPIACCMLLCHTTASVVLRRKGYLII